MGAFIAGLVISAIILAGIPHNLSVTVSGPSNIIDSSPKTVTFSSSISGGESPYSYSWSISTYNFSTIQSYNYSNNGGMDFTVTFSANASNFAYGNNVIYNVSVRITDNNGIQASNYINLMVSY